MKLACLKGVNLEGADLCGANLEYADLEDACIQSSKYDSCTIWPENFDPKKAGAILVDQVVL